MRGSVSVSSDCCNNEPWTGGSDSRQAFPTGPEAASPRSRCGPIEAGAAEGSPPNLQMLPSHCALAWRRASFLSPSSSKATVLLVQGLPRMTSCHLDPLLQSQWGLGLQHLSSAGDAVCLLHCWQESFWLEHRPPSPGATAFREPPLLSSGCPGRPVLCWA